MKVTGFLAQKKGMRQVFDQEGRLVPVTVVATPALYVTNIYPDRKQIQVATSQSKKHLSRALAGILKKAGLKTGGRKFANLPAPEMPEKLGTEIKAAMVFQPGQLVKVSGTSKGRGFAGVIKRWGFHSQPKTHGQSDRERAPGSIGAQTPGRVLKGKKMPGHYGHQRVTVKNLLVVKVDEKKNELWLRGAVPGHYGSWLYLEVEGQAKKFVPLAGEEKKEKENEEK